MRCQYGENEDLLADMMTGRAPYDETRPALVNHLLRFGGRDLLASVKRCLRARCSLDCELMSWSVTSRPLPLRLHIRPFKLIIRALFLIGLRMLDVVYLALDGVPGCGVRDVVGVYLCEACAQVLDLGLHAVGMIGADCDTDNQAAWLAVGIVVVAAHSDRIAADSW